MKQKSEPIVILPNFIMPEGIVQIEDQGTGSVRPFIPASSFLGISSFSFNFFNEGGTNNLKPGRPTTQTASFQGPNLSGAFVNLTSFTGAFVTDGGTRLTERPLGEFQVRVGFANRNTVSCTIQLSDSNSDDPVRVIVGGIIVFFR